MKKAVFILSSGRSGSKALVKMLAGSRNIDAHHEYARDFFQSTVARYYMGLTSRNEALDCLNNTYSGAIRYAMSDIFLDSSNKLCWCADLLKELFPDCEIIHVTRDGRKVASSFYHKLKHTIYPDIASEAFYNYFINKMSGNKRGEVQDNPIPPPIEQFWWIYPTKSLEEFETFHRSSRFEKCCYHWSESNQAILEKKDELGASYTHFRLEELTSSEVILRNLVEKIGIDYKKEYFAALQRPEHVYVPVDFPLNEEQSKSFKLNCESVMTKLGYSLDKPEYRVEY